MALIPSLRDKSGPFESLVCRYDGCWTPICKGLHRLLNRRASRFWRLTVGSPESPSQKSHWLPLFFCPGQRLPQTCLSVLSRKNSSATELFILNGRPWWSQKPWLLNKQQPVGGSFQNHLLLRWRKLKNNDESLSSKSLKAQIEGEDVGYNLVNLRGCFRNKLGAELRRHIIKHRLQILITAGLL